MSDEAMHPATESIYTVTHSFQPKSTIDEVAFGLTSKMMQLL